MPTSQPWKIGRFFFVIKSRKIFTGCKLFSVCEHFVDVIRNEWFSKWKRLEGLKEVKYLQTKILISVFNFFSGKKNAWNLMFYWFSNFSVLSFINRWCLSVWNCCNHGSHPRVIYILISNWNEQQQQYTREKWVYAVCTLTKWFAKSRQHETAHSSLSCFILFCLRLLLCTQI